MNWDAYRWDRPTTSARGISRVVAVVVVVWSLLAGCSTSEDAQPEDGTDLQAELDALLEHAEGPVGIVVTIDTGSDVVVHSAGETAEGSGEEPTSEDHVRVASLSKAMTGAVALSLVDEGVLSVADTVGQWRPDLPAEWHPVTLEHLLGHTSGVPDFGRTEAFGAAVGASLTAAPPPTEILAMAGTGTDFAPGDRYEYSNSNPFVTALIVEAATGEDFADVLHERVLAPLDMADTRLPDPDDPTVPSPTMRGYDSDPDGGAQDVTEDVAFGGWAWASGGIVSTPADLAKFVQGYVGGELFGDDVRASQRRVVSGDSSPPGPGENSAGLALFTYETSCGTVYGHTGSILGYTQFMAASEDGTRSVTFTISTQVGDELLSDLRAAQDAAVCEALRP